MCMSYYTATSLLYICLHWHAFSYYINMNNNTFPWLYGLLIGCTSHCEDFNIYFIAMIYSATSLPPFLTFFKNILLTPIYLNLPFSCRMNWNKYLCFQYLNISYIFFLSHFFCCFLNLGNIFTFNLQDYKTCIQHHIYTIVDKISSILWFLSSSKCRSNAWHWQQGELLQNYIFQVERISELVYIPEIRLKLTFFVLICLTIKGLVEYSICVYQDGIPISVGDA